MASKSSASVLSLFLALNLLFFASVSACGSCTSSKPKLEATPPEGAAPPEGACPRDALKLGVCADLLGSLLNINIGTPPNTPCCSLIEGLADLEAAVCVCTAIKANVLGIINLDVPLSLSLLLNACSKQVPSDFQCA